MKQLAMLAAVAAGVLVTFVLPGSIREGAAAQEPRKPECSFLPKTLTLDPKPQSSEYRGGCLEYLPHIELVDAAGLPLPLFTGATGDGSTPQPRLARGHHGNKQVRVRLTPVSITGHSFGPVQFYEVRSDEGKKENLCDGEEYDGTYEKSTDAAVLNQLKGKAVAIPGYWEGGAWHPSPVGTHGESSFSLSCLSGVMAKCALWGYAPWNQHKGVSLEPYHVACVQAARAQYLADFDMSYTCRKTVIDMYDRLGILTKSTDPAYKFESLWGKNGRVCMARSRFEACMPELQDAGLAAAPQTCKEPPAPGKDWPEGVLIAVSSQEKNIATRLNTQESVCPSRREARCRQ